MSIVRKKITLQDMLVLVELVQMALARLDFSDLDQELSGSGLLWLVNCVGAAYEYQRQGEEAG